VDTAPAIPATAPRYAKSITRHSGSHACPVAAARAHPPAAGGSATAAPTRSIPHRSLLRALAWQRGKAPEPSFIPPIAQKTKNKTSSTIYETGSNLGIQIRKWVFTPEPRTLADKGQGPSLARNRALMPENLRTVGRRGRDRTGRPCRALHPRRIRSLFVFPRGKFEQVKIAVGRLVQFWSTPARTRFPSGDQSAVPDPKCLGSINRARAEPSEGKMQR